MTTAWSGTGAETLSRMNRLDRYNRWVMDAIAPWIGDVVLEVGAGIGNFSRFLLDRRQVILTDTDPVYLEILESLAARYAHVSVEPYDLDGSGARFSGRGIDTIVALNVLEHIVDDEHALREMTAMLAPGGRIVLQLPAHPALYGTLDRYLDHYRRYTRSDIGEKIRRAGLVPETIRRMNMAGAAGWFVSSRLLKRKLLPAGQLRVFNQLTPLFMALEHILPPPFGLSLIVVARKP